MGELLDKFVKKQAEATITDFYEKHELKYGHPKKTYTDNNGNTFELDSLKPCPCCGGDADLEFIGNTHTKSRKTLIRCTKCFLKRTDAEFYKDAKWCATQSIKQWNKRICCHPVTDEMKKAEYEFLFGDKKQ